LDTRPDAVVLDVQLLGGSGLQVLSKVHPQAPAIMFVVLTNYPNPQYRDVYLAAGASQFMDKNTDFARVAELIGGLRAMPQPSAADSNPQQRG
jgi:DNA-binding NarL/FixJ family response regulator